MEDLFCCKKGPEDVALAPRVITGLLCGLE